MRIEKRLRRWGNSYGIPLSKKEVEALRAAEGDMIAGELSSHPVGTDFRGLPTYRLGGRDDVDAALEDEAVARR